MRNQDQSTLILIPRTRNRVIPPAGMDRSYGCVLSVASVRPASGSPAFSSAPRNRTLSPPPRFASYIAASAACQSSPKVGTGADARGRPDADRDADVLLHRRARDGRAQVLRDGHRVARRRRPGRTTANSSPPTRAEASISRVQCWSAAATWRIAWSPVGWPSVSFRALNSSTSIASTLTRPPSRWVRARARRRSAPPASRGSAAPSARRGSRARRGRRRAGRGHRGAGP